MRACPRVRELLARLRFTSLQLRHDASAGRRRNFDRRRILLHAVPEAAFFDGFWRDRFHAADRLAEDVAESETALFTVGDEIDTGAFLDFDGLIDRRVL